jgi:hypothetical protein
MLRWLLFILLWPVNMLTVLLQMLYAPYFLWKVKGRYGNDEVKVDHVRNLDQIIKLAKNTPYKSNGFSAEDDHCLLVEAGNGLFNPEIQNKLIESTVKPNGSLFRKVNLNGTEAAGHVGVSGDCLASWMFAYKLWNINRPDLVERVASHYVKHCFGLRWNEKNGVSARCSHGGLNVVVDGWPVNKKLLGYTFKHGSSEPLAGPSLLSTQAVLELAASEVGGKWKLIAKAHFLLMGVWFFKYMPMSHLPKDPIFYLQHITMLNLWVLAECGKNYNTAIKAVESMGPRGRAQPWITGLAWDQGLVDENRRQEAVKYLQGIKGATTWPQIAITSSHALDQRHRNETNFSMMGLAAMLLKLD